MKFKKFTLFAFSMVLFTNIYSQAFTTAANGNWNATTTWTGGVVPDANATSITINHNVTVSADATVPCALTVAASKTLTVNSGINFTVDFTLTAGGSTINTVGAKFLVAGSLINNGTINVNGAVEQTGSLSQTSSSAIFNIDGSDGSAVSSIPDGTSLFKTNSLLNMTAGTLCFYQPPYGAASKTWEYTTTYTFNNLDIRFGISSSSPTTLNTKGFDLSPTSSNGIIFRNFTIDNAGGTGQKVTQSSGYLYPKGNTAIAVNEIYDAPFSTFYFEGNLTVNGILVSNQIWYLGNTNNTITKGSMGSFQNTLASPTVSTNNFTKSGTGKITFDNFNFSTPSITLNAGLVELSNSELTITNGHASGLQGTPSNSCYIATNTNGSLKIKQPAATVINPGKLLPIGTQNTYAPITMYQLTAAGSAADDFSYRVENITGVNNVSECHKVIWNINEGTPGGNTSYYFTFQWNPTTDVNSNFASAFSDVYNDNGSGWNVSTYNRFLFKPTSSTLNELVSVNNSGNSERGKFTIASGKGILASGKNIIGSNVANGNWSAGGTWAGGVVPTSNDIAYIKTGHTISLDADAPCNGLQNSGTLNMNANTLTVGPTGGGRAFTYTDGALNIATGTLNVNGEFYKNIGTVSMNGGTINLDPNNGNAATSRTVSNYTVTPQPLTMLTTGGANNIAGTIKILDPVNQATGNGFNLNIAKSGTGTINYIFGDGTPSGSSVTTEEFSENAMNSILTNVDNVTVNTSGETNATLKFINGSANFNVKNFTINSGTTFLMNGGFSYLNLYGDLTNNGTFGNGTTTHMACYSTTTTQNITGSGIFNTSGNLEMLSNQNTNINTTNNLQITNLLLGGATRTGKFIINNTNLIMTSNPSGGASSSYVVTNGTGRLFRNNFVTNYGAIFPIGASTTSYTPITIQAAASGHTTDNIGVRVGVGVIRNPSMPNVNDTIVGDVVFRTWDITETTPGGSNVTITPQWFAADEMPGFTRTNCYVAHHTGGTWNTATGAAATGTGPYAISKVGVTSFSPFAVTNGGISLPVNWLQTNATLTTENKATIGWQVQENSVQQYEVEKSIDGINFSSISTINSLGNGTHNYSYTETNKLDGLAYYRIKQTNLNTTHTYSKVMKLNISNKNWVKLQSNMVNDILQINIVQQKALGTSYKIYNNNGSLMHSGKILQNNTSVTTSLYSSGIYYVQIENGEKYRFIKY